MSQWLSDAWDGVRDRASKMSLSQWLVVAAVATAGGLVIYRRERRKAFNRMIASWKVDLTDEERHVIAFIFHIIDHDHNLALDRREFRSFIEATPQLSSVHKSLQLDAFSLLDSDDNGSLSLPEFESFFRGIKNLAGNDIATALLNHFVETIKEKAAAAGQQVPTPGGEDPTSESTTMITKRRAAFKSSNEFEKAILENVIMPKDIKVKFDDIGSLAKEKAALRELIIFPLRHPEFFREGIVSKAVKGILLFGPPGTGKTMLAKAVATESGATFINIGASTLGSKWYGESEKFAKAVFTVARKLEPSVIFIDEIDSLLQSRDSGGSSVFRSVQTVLMTEWDGLASGNERIVVLGATNRPFDLDEAILRRMPRRLLVDVPDAAGREKILKKLLSKDRLYESVDLAKVAGKTKGFTGSDLQNLCREAAYIRIREAMAASPELGNGAGDDESKGESKGSAQEESKGGAKEGSAGAAAKPEPKKDAKLRPISNSDFRKALKTCRPSVAEDGEVARVRNWNSEYGDFGVKNARQNQSMYL